MSDIGYSQGYALEGVEIVSVARVSEVRHVSFAGQDFIAGESEYLLKVPGVADFYVSGGNRVEYRLHEGADPDWVQLILNSRVLVALLHQRGIVSFHAGSFVHNGRGVMVIGATGAGKTSLTLAFALNGAGFLADDLTPVVFPGGVPSVMPLHRRVKLRPDTARQLAIYPSRLTEAERGTGKLYLPLTPVQDTSYPISIIIHLETGQAERPLFNEPTSAERFALLRSEICSWEMLAAMPETEKAYLQQLVDMIHQVRFIRVVRTDTITVSTLYQAVKEYLDNDLR